MPSHEELAAKGAKLPWAKEKNDSEFIPVTQGIGVIPHPPKEAQEPAMVTIKLSASTFVELGQLLKACIVTAEQINELAADEAKQGR